MKYLLAIKERERVWSCYDKYMKNVAMREKLSLKLLQLAVDDKNVERVKELLEKYNHGNIDDDLIQSLMELAVEEDRIGGREWRNIGYTLMDKLSANEAMINDSTAMCIIKWLRRYGNDDTIIINNYLVCGVEKDIFLLMILQLISKNKNNWLLKLINYCSIVMVFVEVAVVKSKIIN